MSNEVGNVSPKQGFWSGCLRVLSAALAKARDWLWEVFFKDAKGVLNLVTLALVLVAYSSLAGQGQQIKNVQSQVFQLEEMRRAVEDPRITIVSADYLRDHSGVCVRFKNVGKGHAKDAYFIIRRRDCRNDPTKCLIKRAYCIVPGATDSLTIDLRSCLRFTDREIDCDSTMGDQTFLVDVQWTDVQRKLYHALQDSIRPGSREIVIPDDALLEKLEHYRKCSSSLYTILDPDSVWIK